MSKRSNSKKLAAFVPILMAACLAFTACAGNPYPPDGSASGKGLGLPDPEHLRIVIVTSPSGVDDGGYNQDNYEGVLAFVDKNPGAAEQSIREPDLNRSMNAVNEVLADHDVVVTPGYQFSGVYSLAIKNPEKYFILVDTFPTDKDGEVRDDAPNVCAMQFAEEEGGFFAGIAAALETKSGKVAVVNGIAYPSNVNYQYGFMSGVKYAEKHYGVHAEIVELPSYAGTDVTNRNIGGNYIGGFDDPATGKVVAEALLSKGVDIIFVAAGGSGSGVFTAVKENGHAKVIGCDVDQWKEGENGSSNIVLTSSLKRMSVNVEKRIEAIRKGKFQGGNFTMGADTDSVGYVSEPGHHQLSADTLKNMEEAYDLVKDGSIVPASAGNRMTTDGFKGL
ncbi:MAG: BMP family ABC transporter substrate-binding protein [Clostridiales Family XIII bacterium]|nr:BMP family ABC transporter substrate-binding protein [Clostridiales Family XIII bacterium]